MIGYQAGEVEAFEELYRMVKPGLYRFLLIKTLSRQWAEELLQETFLQIHRARRTYLPGKPVAPWLYAIARHVYLMSLRSHIRKIASEGQLQRELLDLPLPPEIDTRAELDSIRKVLTKLAPEQREALLLHHYWDFSFKEIGSIIGIRAGTAKLRAYRGMSKLRELLGLDVVT